MKKILTIAGSDSSGGAGVQADLKTFAALGTYGMSVIVALTAQNTKGVSMVVNTPVDMVIAQLQAVYDDIPPDAVKTGMLSTPAIVHGVADFLKQHGGVPLVVDPVMVSTSGSVLLEKAAIEIYKKELFPLATLVTPNIPEAEVLTGMTIKTEKDMEEAACRLMTYGMKAVLVKGGHRVNDSLDILYDGKEMYPFHGEKLETENTHGTGCTLSSALAVMLSKGLSPEVSVGAAKCYLTGAIKGAMDVPIGHGNGPIHHFWFYKDQWGNV